MWKYLMGNPGTARYRILVALKTYRALSYSGLKRKSSSNESTLANNLKELINERIVKKWDFNGYYVIYSHCFVPFYEVKEIYEKKYPTLSANARNRTKDKMVRKLEQVLKN